MPSIMSFMPFIEPDTLPKTMPGMTNSRKISDTIDCMIGAWKVAMLPSASRHGEFSGISVSARMTSPATIDASDHRSPRRSASVSSCISGRSSAAPSISMPASRGSTTRSVRYQPSPTMSADDAVVKK